MKTIRSPSEEAKVGKSFSSMMGKKDSSAAKEAMEMFERLLKSRAIKKEGTK